MNTLNVFSVLLILLLLHGHGGGAATYGRKIVRSYEPCKELVVYMHDIIYNGKNAENSTSAIVAALEGHKKTLPEGRNIVVFDDPLTCDNNLNSSPVGRAQGFYSYIKKDVYTSWLGFSLVFNSAEHKGTINIAGSNPQLNKTRDLSVIGGTGDFFMARGVATFTTDAVEGQAYFRLKIDVKLYECW